MKIKIKTVDLIKGTIENSEIEVTEKQAVELKEILDSLSEQGEIYVEEEI